MLANASDQRFLVEPTLQQPTGTAARLVLNLQPIDEQSQRVDDGLQTIAARS